MSYEIKIDKSDEGVSPKNFLKKRLDVSYSRLMKLIKEKRISLNGKRIKEDSRLEGGDVIKIWIDDIKMREMEYSKKISGKDLGIYLIFENSDFLVLNKLPGVVVQGSTDISKSLSLHLAFLKEKNKDSSSFSYFHVHRLDKDTSGVLVCAKNKISLRELNRVFREKELVKKYVCLCSGSFERESGKIECLLDRNPEGSKEKMRVSKNSGKKSLSLYKVLEEYEFENEIFSLVEVEIKTGLMHQIRVHMKSLGHPIVMDKMYGNSFVNKMFEKLLDRQFLHAKSLEFEFKNEKFEFEADLTDDLDKCLEKIS